MTDAFKKLRYTLLPVAVLWLFGCSVDDEVLFAPEPVLEINRFIWTNMDAYYYWTSLMPRDVDWQTEPDPVDFFEKLLYKPEDRWSYITDNARELKNSLDGIERTFGHQYRLFQLPNTQQVFGVVEYVIRDSPAHRAGMQRGDLFYKVNGTVLTTSNYASLLFGVSTYSLDLGRIEDNTITDAERRITLNAELLQEHPVHFANVLELEGHSIGYLMYNQFLSEFENDLDSVFQTFKVQQVTDLVLDLRYNPGGSASTAAYLGSLIAPASVVAGEEIFNTYLYNDLLTQFLIENGGPDSPNLSRRFSHPANNLDLDRVYILISSNTASASELVINGLAPYMEVILIGPESTSGKYTGSITIEDEDAEHGWALQPIISKVANALGESDYVNGFAPDFIVEDDLTAPIGTLEEDMLAEAIALITGARSPARKGLLSTYESIGSAGMYPVEQNQKLWMDQETPGYQPIGRLD